MKTYDVVVIGGGQAGLAVGYYLKQQNRSFVILDKGSEAGETWRNRYDSLVLFTPRYYSSLPGLKLDGNVEGYATKNEIAEYLKKYSRQFELPIHFNTEVYSLHKSEDKFYIQTNHEDYVAREVIIATGPFQRPFIPAMSLAVSQEVFQVHTDQYMNPKQLHNGSVLVVGAGNSGAQIAVELAQEREVYLSVGHPISFMPLQLIGKSIFWWFGKLGILSANTDSRLGKLVRNRPDPIFGFQLKALIKQGKVKMLPRTVSVRDKLIHFEDGKSIQVNNIVWATGFHSDYSWIQIPNVVDDKGKPIHDRGVTKIKGLYFVGLPWQYTRGSALIGGVAQDAEYITALHLEK